MGVAKPAQEGKMVSTRANVIPLNFKVSAEFRKRFRERGLGADLKFNELLVEALDAWEPERNLRRSHQRQ